MAYVKKKGGRSSKAKGTRAEVEFCQIATELGVPSIRVLGSGAFKGAAGDIKIGVELLPDGTLPEADEAVAMLRAECKNRKINPDAPFYSLKEGDIVVVIPGGREAPDLPFNDLAQNPIAKVGVWKRAKTPKGALAEKRYNEAYLCFMGATDFLNLLKELKELRQYKEANERRS
jgi:hypothetical protein